jgi:transcriptional regulator with XRE-family HTH domain
VEWGRSDVAGPNGAVVRRLHLGRILRELREQAGLSLEVAAPAFDWSSSKLSRIENGVQGVDVHGVRTMMDIYGVGGPRWEELLDLARLATKKGWWRAYGLDDRGYVPLEAGASTVRDVTLGFVPGLLQSPAYSRAIFGSALAPRTSVELDNAVAIRTVRQERLTSDEDPLDLVALVDEAALRRPVGGREVMREQYTNLLAAAALERVVLRVLPTGLGARPAMSAGFTLLGFDDPGLPDMVYVEHPVGAIHVFKESDVARAKLVFDRLLTLALDTDASAVLIERMAGES